MTSDFFAYEMELGRRFLIPLLEGRGVRPEGSILDVGCGYGGVLAALAGRYPAARCLGLDVDAEMVAAGREKCPAGVRLETGDFFRLEGEGFDLILMRDVLEHIVRPEAALERAASLLNPGGLLFASFAPFHSPFGGHQHNGEGFFSRLPWLQFLPENLFRVLVRVSGNSYKTREGLVADMDTVLRTRLSIARFRRAARQAGLGFRHYAGYAVRPDYRLKFGLPPLRFPALPLLEEMFSTGVEALLARP